MIAQAQSGTGKTATFSISILQVFVALLLVISAAHFPLAVVNHQFRRDHSLTCFSLQSIDTTVRETQVLCLSPTRELAVQIQKVIFVLFSHKPFLLVAPQRLKPPWMLYKALT